MTPVNESIWLRSNLRLPCPPPSNLAEVSWQRDARPLPPSDHFQVLPDGLLISNASALHAGRYRCASLERSQAGDYTSVVADYQVSLVAGEWPQRPQARQDGPSVVGLQATVGILVVLLAGLLCWNFLRGHLPLPCKLKDVRSGGESRYGSAEPASLEDGKKHSGHGSGDRNGENVLLHTDEPKQFIGDESEI